MIEFEEIILNILNQKSKEKAKFKMSLVFYESDYSKSKKPLDEIWSKNFKICLTENFEPVSLSRKWLRPVVFQKNISKTTKKATKKAESKNSN